MLDADNLHVLFVEDNTKLLHMYREWLEGRYEVSTAATGADALDTIDDSVDILFLDRRLGTMSGGEVLDEMTARGIDCYVVVLTRLRPDIEIIQREFDAYLEKPVSEQLLLSVVDTIHHRSQYNDSVREWVAIQNRIEVLEDVMADERQSQSAFLTELHDYADRLQAELDETAAELEHLLVRPDEIEIDE